MKKVKKSKLLDIPLGGTLMQRTPVNSEIDYPMSQKSLQKINYATGQKNGVVRKANQTTPLANMMEANLTARQVQARKLQPLNVFGEGLYASPPPTGTGLYAGGAGLYAGRQQGSGINGYGLKKNSHGNHRLHHFTERGSIGIHGNLLHQPQALTSQPYSINFGWGHTLPPYYQKFNQG